MGRNRNKSTCNILKRYVTETVELTDIDMLQKATCSKMELVQKQCAKNAYCFLNLKKVFDLILECGKIIPQRSNV
jgi:hypothetical protein